MGHHLLLLHHLFRPYRNDGALVTLLHCSSGDCSTGGTGQRRYERRFPQRCLYRNDGK
jgi:hypothetical protein